MAQFQQSSPITVTQSYPSLFLSPFSPLLSLLPSPDEVKSPDVIKTSAHLSPPYHHFSIFKMEITIHTFLTELL